jgi:hypothetical protein
MKWEMCKRSIEFDIHVYILYYHNHFRCIYVGTETVYSYLMGVQAIDQNIFPEVLGKTDQSVLLPEVKIVENKQYFIKHVKLYN